MHHALLAACVALFARCLHGQNKAVPSPHRIGPGGLKGWTLSYDIAEPSQGPLPMTLVLARNGRVFRRLHGDPFLWTWMFAGAGRHVAFEAGPLHFSMACVLVDIRSGKQISRYDCFGDRLPASAPAWVTALEAQARNPNPP